MNFADNIQVVENILHSNPFVQQVINFKSKVPSVICYLPDQIQDMKRFYAVPDGAVLGFDKTFNLADIHVTVAVFKHKAVLKYDARDHPIFFGPFFFHGNCDELVYNQFMSELSRHFTREEQRTYFLDQMKKLHSGILSAITFRSPSRLFVVDI